MQNKKMKKSKRTVILSAILIMCMSISLLAGATFALFTSEAKVNIAVTSGKVDVKAEISNFEAYTPKLIDTDNQNTISDDTNIANNDADVKVFGNGGTASLKDAEISLNNIAPGDKVTFNIKITNYSNVKIKYRTFVKNASEESSDLLEVLSFNLGEMTIGSSSAWKALDANANEEGTIIGEYACSIELPVSVKDAKYQDKSCKLMIGVEAIQANAATQDINTSANVTVASDNIDTNNQIKQEVTLASVDTITVGETKVAQAKALVPAETKLATGATELKLTVAETTAPSNFSATDGKDNKTFEIKMDGIDSANEAKITVEVFVGTELANPVMYHNGVAMDASDYSYNSTTGVMTIKTASFSPFTIEYQEGIAKIGATYYASVRDALAVANATTEDTTIAVIKDSQGGGLKTNDGSVTSGNITIDFGGHTYTVVNPAVGSKGTETQAMHFGKSATSMKLLNGKIILDASVPNLKMIMQCYIDLTLEKMTIDGSSMNVVFYGENEFTGIYEPYNGLEVPFFNLNGAENMTLKDSHIILPSASNKGVYNEQGNVYLINTVVDGYVCNEQASAKTYVDSTSKINGFVSYFSGYTTNTASQDAYTLYTVTETN